MITTERSRERRRRRLFAALAGWALLGAASTGIVACTNAAADTGTSPSSATTSSSATPSPSSSSIAAPSSTMPSSSASSSAVSSSSTSSAAPSSTAAATTADPTTAAASTYQDGTYTATGSYSSPGGTESVSITLTLTGDVITDATGEGEATGGPSSQYQEKFTQNFAALIVGKDIDEVSLDKVAGSSLTSTGFNEAVQSIKSDALA